MNRYKAEKIYLKSLIHSETMIKRIIRWDKKISILENSKNIGISYDTSKMMVERFNLKYKKIGSGNNYPK